MHPTTLSPNQDAVHRFASLAGATAAPEGERSDEDSLLRVRERHCPDQTARRGTGLRAPLCTGISFISGIGTWLK
jgi:hypothetical protein